MLTSILIKEPNILVFEFKFIFESFEKEIKLWQYWMKLMNNFMCLLLVIWRS